MVHRLQTINRAKVSRVIGHADEETMLAVTRPWLCSSDWHDGQHGSGARALMKADNGGIAELAQRHRLIVPP
jgi:hypothetical protein